MALEGSRAQKGNIAIRKQIKTALLGSVAAALAAAASPANATVYNVDRTIDGGSVVGTITTDGAMGTIDPSDFTAWDLVLSGPGSTVTISSSDTPHAVYGSGADITADATQISFNFSASDGGFLVFQQTMNSGQTIGASIPTTAHATIMNPWFRRASWIRARSLRTEAARLSSRRRPEPFPNRLRGP
jgi:hypothetical protein